MDIQYGPGHGHAAWTGICSMGKDMQHEYGHTAWTWALILTMSMGIHMDGHGHDQRYSITQRNMFRGDEPASSEYPCFKKIVNFRLPKSLRCLRYRHFAT
jgi:hypothetical protein